MILRWGQLGFVCRGSACRPCKYAFDASWNPDSSIHICIQPLQAAEKPHPPKKDRPPPLASARPGESSSQSAPEVGAPSSAHVAHRLRANAAYATAHEEERRQEEQEVLREEVLGGRSPATDGHDSAAAAAALHL